eukprot:CAMPEP_0197909390 /NCGR_PEP_ID=MMETSP1439-20131203/68803_1 /TAXON_ID=66791 /ORGANISM="Gonyaulax spinifera, Strain CCMP409" /LENGTH=51 /DNA_ID=CAMNT_0043530965 /DNA_START=1 /DNA_END=153 /DNA_ORIENTATION=-
MDGVTPTSAGDRVATAARAAGHSTVRADEAGGGVKALRPGRAAKARAARPA